MPKAALDAAARSSKWGVSAGGAVRIGRCVSSFPLILRPALSLAMERTIPRSRIRGRKLRREPKRKGQSGRQRSFRPHSISSSSFILLNFSLSSTLDLDLRTLPPPPPIKKKNCSPVAADQPRLSPSRPQQQQQPSTPRLLRLRSSHSEWAMASTSTASRRETTNSS